MARGGFSTRIEGVEGLDRARAALGRLRELGGDLLPFMQDARTILVKNVLGRFEGGYGPGRIPWQPSRRALGLVKGKPGGRTLVDTSDLQDSIRGEATSTYVEVGSDGLKDPVKALANQFGSHRQSVVVAHERTVTQAFGAPLASPTVQHVRAHGRITNLPARPFIGFDDQDVEEIKDVWQRRIIATYGSASNA